MKLVSSKKNRIKPYTGFRVTRGWEILALLLLIPIWFVSCAPPISKESHEYINPNTFKENAVSGVQVAISQVPSASCSTDCNTSPKDEQQSSWNISNGFFKDKRDLNAQEGVWRASNITAFYSLVMAALTAIGVYLLALTWRATQDTMRFASDSLEQARLATDASNRTAESAEEALAQTHLATEIELQPYLSFEYVGARIVACELPDFDIEITIRVRNSGKTPAYYFRVDCWKNYSSLSANSWSHYINTPFNLRDAHIAADSVEQLAIKFRCCINKGPMEVRGRLSPNSVIESLRLNEMKIGYKDNFVLGTNKHRVIMGEIFFSTDNPSSNRARVNSPPKTEQDGNGSFFNDFSQSESPY